MIMDQAGSKRWIMVVAGEASGDFHGANVVKSLKKKTAAFEFMGIGGKALKEQGVKLLAESDLLSVVGITEVFSRLPYLLKAIRAVKRALRQFKPELLILIDFPDFNLFLAGIAKKLKVPILYYISPQVWAWRPGRVRKIRGLVDHMAVILPFETRFYRKHGVKATFVGHPLLDSVAPVSLSTYENQLSTSPVLGLLPGSRDREILNHLPMMLEAANLLKQTFSNLKVLISVASSVNRDLVEQIMEKHQYLSKAELVEGGAFMTIKRSSVLVAVSGTVTLEAALSGIPMVVIYRVSLLSYQLAKVLVRVRFVSLVNLIARRELLPELIQDMASPENIAETVEKMLNNPKQLIMIHRQLSRIRKAFGRPGASERVASIALDIINNKNLC